MFLLPKRCDKQIHVERLKFREFLTILFVTCFKVLDPEFSKSIDGIDVKNLEKFAAFFEDLSSEVQSTSFNNANGPASEPLEEPIAPPFRSRSGTPCDFSRLNWDLDGLESQFGWKTI